VQLEAIQRFSKGWKIEIYWAALRNEIELNERTGLIRELEVFKVKVVDVPDFENWERYGGGCLQMHQLAIGLSAMQKKGYVIKSRPDILVDDSVWKSLFSGIPGRVDDLRARELFGLKKKLKLNWMSYSNPFNFDDLLYAGDYDDLCQICNLSDEVLAFSRFNRYALEHLGSLAFLPSLMLNKNWKRWLRAFYPGGQFKEMACLSFMGGALKVIPWSAPYHWYLAFKTKKYYIFGYYIQTVFARCNVEWIEGPAPGLFGRDYWATKEEETLLGDAFPLFGLVGAKSMNSLIESWDKHPVLAVARESACYLNEEIELVIPRKVMLYAQIIELRLAVKHGFAQLRCYLGGKRRMLISQLLKRSDKK